MPTAKGGVAVAPQQAAPFIRFPDYQPSEDTGATFTHGDCPAQPAALARHLRSLETTINSNEIAAAQAELAAL